MLLNISDMIYDLLSMLSDRGGVNLEIERPPTLRVPTIAVEPSSSQARRSGVQTYSSAQQCAPRWMFKAIVVQVFHHRLRFLWPHASHGHLCHKCDAPEISNMQSHIAVSKEVPRNCAPTPLAPATFECADVLGLSSGLPAEVAILHC